MDYVKIQGGFEQLANQTGIDIYTNDTLRATGSARLNITESGIIDLTYTEVGNIEIAAVEVDGSTTNEIQDSMTRLSG